MRIFAISFALGAFFALAVESQADDETLPLPINTIDSTSSYRSTKTHKADMIHESRVQRAKYVAAQHLAVETMNRWSGVNPGRPQVNSGFVFLAPPRATYRWFGPNQATYIYPYGIPIQ